LRILVASTEEMLSNASERRDSMAEEGQVCLDGKSAKKMGICRTLSAEDGYLVNVGAVAARRLGTCG
jgi:hypothetical protein